MLNVLIVDDEPYIRQGLRLLIDWEAEGFSIVGEAADGMEALEIIEYTHVDLMIVDVQMPGMGGLPLLSEIRGRGLDDMHVVVLSGYREFSYAQTAMKYGCLDYIIKPINRDELLSLLRGIYEQHRQKRLDREEAEMSSIAMLERNLISLIMGKYDEINLRYVREHLSLTNKIRYIGVELDITDPRLYEKDESNRRSLQRVLFSGLRSTLGENGKHVIFDVTKQENCYDVGLIFCDRMAKEKGMREQEYFNWLMSRIESGVECRIVMQVGSEVDSPERLSESYRSANVAKFMQDFQENEMLCLGDEYPQMQNELSAEVYAQVRNYLDEVVSAVERGNQQEIEDAVDALYRSMGESNMDYRFIGMTVSNILFRLINKAVERDSNLDQQEAVNYIIENAFNKGVARGSAAHFAAFCCDYADYLKQMEDRSAGNTLGMVEREIAEKYMTNISLKQLGEKFFINSAYLGQLFKKQYGMSFKDYLNMVRINKSVELLEHTDMKVYEISAAVGYQSVDYFINKFVAQRGHTPAKFRKTVRLQAGELVDDELTEE